MPATPMTKATVRLCDQVPGQPGDRDAESQRIVHNVADSRTVVTQIVRAAQREHEIPRATTE